MITERVRLAENGDGRWWKWGPHLSERQWGTVREDSQRGGNSSWRGPIWFPLNFLIVESLLKFHDYYGDDFRIECPTGSGRTPSTREVAEELARRLVSIFLPDERGRRPVFGGEE